MAVFLPQVQKKLGFGETIGASLGAGLSEGLVSGLERKRKEKEFKQSELLKNKSKIRSSAKSGLSLYDKNKAFDSDMTSKLEELMHEYVGQGFSPDEAFSQAYSDISGGLKSEGLKTPSEKIIGSESSSSFKDKILGIPSKLGAEITDFPEKASRQLAQMGRKGVSAAEGLYDYITSSQKTSPIQGLAPHGRETLTQEKIPSATSFYDKLVGEKGIPRNALEDIGSSAIFGVSGMAGEATKLALKEAGAPEWMQNVGDIGVMLLTQGGFSKFAKGTELLKDVAKASKRTGIPADDIFKSTGVDLAKVAAGDEAAISELSQRITEIPGISKKVKEVPKSVYNKEAAIREREVFGSKLPNSPLEDYYAIREGETLKELNKRPETKARDLEVRERLKPEETKLYEDLRNQKEQLQRIKKDKMRSTNPSDMERLGALEEFQAQKLDKISEQLKDVQYEMKYARSRPSEAEIDSQIQKSVEKYKEGIENPKEGFEGANRQIELDRKYLDRASKILERGELPGEFRPDTFIKMKKKYLDGYEAAMNKSHEIIDALKGQKDAASIRRVSEEQQLIDRLTPRVKRLEADVINQTDNIKAMNALDKNKASGAFYKQQIKGLRKDLERFDYDLFKQKRIKNPQEIKTQKAFKENSKQIEKGKDLIENPSKESIKEAAEDAGISESEFSKALKEMRDGTKEAAEEIKKGTVTPNTEHKLVKTMKKQAAKVGVGAAVGMSTALIEQEFGIKIKNQDVRTLFTLFGAGASLGGTYGGHKLISSWYDHSQAEELKKLRGNVREWNRYLKNMEEKNGKAKKNRVLKLANQ